MEQKWSNSQKMMGAMRKQLVWDKQTAEKGIQKVILADKHNIQTYRQRDRERHTADGHTDSQINTQTQANTYTDRHIHRQIDR